MLKQAMMGACALVIGCMNWQENQSHVYQVYIDPQFDAQEQVDIMQAAFDWEDATNGYIKFERGFDSSAADTISFFPADSFADLYQDCDSDGVLGCEYSDGVQEHIFMPRLSAIGDQSKYLQILRHETGHSIGLIHTSSGVMCKDQGCASMTIQCIDVQQVCSVWNKFDCDPNSFAVCQGQ